MLLPACTALEIWVWISRLPCVRWSRVLFVMTGRRAASGGKSHSWVTATSLSPHPSAKTISVALGSSEQILRPGVIPRPALWRERDRARTSSHCAIHLPPTAYAADRYQAH